jgi:myotubularin-related protein 1/2
MDGTISINANFEGTNGTKLLKIALSKSTNDLLKMAVDEFVPKKEQVAQNFLLTLSTKSSEECELLFCAPLWLYNLTPQDTVILRKRTATASRTSSDDETGEDQCFNIGKFFFVCIQSSRSRVATLPYNPSLQTPSDFLNSAVRYGAWKGSKGESGINSKHVKYFCLVAHFANGEKQELNTNELITNAHLPNLSIVTIERSNVYELVIEHSEGPIKPLLASFYRHCKMSVNNAFSLPDENAIIVRGNKNSIIETINRMVSSNKKRKTIRIDTTKLTELTYQGREIEDFPGEFQDGEKLLFTFHLSGESEQSRIVYSLKFSPKSKLSDDYLSAPISCKIDFNQEKVVFGPILNVRRLFFEVHPGDDSSLYTATKGYICVTNYKTYFKNYEGFSMDEISIPHGCVEKVEKYGRQSGGDDNYFVDITTKQGVTYRWLFKKDSANTRKKFVLALKELCFCSQHLRQYMFCFHYKPQYPLDGWKVYQPMNELKRLGVLEGDSGWRVSDVNNDYSVCDTYPDIFAVPAESSDTLVQEVAKFRSRGRLPVLSWRNPITTASISRCAQPCVGITAASSSSDVLFLSNLLQTNKRNSKNLYILDSRPKTNAIANRAVGGGYEDAKHYENASLDFENIANIHVVRESLAAVREACAPTTAEDEYLMKVSNSKWLNLLKSILMSVVKSVALLDQHCASILIHCSDGWDRTSQCSALTQICIDPYFRTIEGFIVLIEKEWLSAGHKFGTRHGMGEEKISSQRAPIFHQFVDCVFQIFSQFPCEFEFNEHFLIELLRAAFDWRFGTFLCDCERERKQAKLEECTPSFWSFVLAKKKRFVNVSFQPGFLSFSFPFFLFHCSFLSFFLFQSSPRYISFPYASRVSIVEKRLSCANTDGGIRFTHQAHT